MGQSQPAPCCFCHAILLTDLPGGNVASRPRETILHELLQLARVSSTGSGSPSDKILQHGSPLESQPFSVLIPCCSMRLSMDCKRSFSPVVISEGCKDSSCHLAMGQREMATLDCLPASLLTNLGDHRVVFLSSCYSLKQKRPLFKRFPLLNNVYPEVLIGSALARGGAELESGELSQNVLQRAHQHPLPPKTTPDTNSTHLRVTSPGKRITVEQCKGNRHF